MAAKEKPQTTGAEGQSPKQPWEIEISPADRKKGLMYNVELEDVLSALVNLNGEADQRTGIATTYSFDGKTFWAIANNIEAIKKANGIFKRQVDAIKREYLRKSPDGNISLASQLERDDRIVALQYTVAIPRFESFSIMALECFGKDAKNRIPPGTVGLLKPFLTDIDKLEKEILR